MAYKNICTYDRLYPSNMIIIKCKTSINMALPKEKISLSLCCKKE
jgi:hypothetical protein